MITQQLLRIAKLLQSAGKVVIDDSLAKNQMKERAENYRDIIEREKEELAEDFDYNSYVRKFDSRLRSRQDRYDDSNNPSEDDVKQVLKWIKEYDALDKKQDLNGKKSLSKSISKYVSDAIRRKQYNLLGITSFLMDFNEYIIADIKDERYVDVDQKMREYEKSEQVDYNKIVFPAVKKMASKLYKFSQYVDLDTDILLKVYDIFSDTSYMMMEPSFYVELKYPYGPQMTVFVNGSKYIVEDVLSVNDSDFFGNPVEQENYFNLVEYLRTGKLPKKREGFIKLYRGMSDDEYDNWKGGQIIPEGKYFTSSKSSALAQDISGEFPNLYSFEVDANIVFETDKGTFQTIMKSKLQGKKIIGV